MNNYIEKLNVCENCDFEDKNEDLFESRSTKYGDVLYCKECACCGECREIIK